jgi:hypothetical protein
MFRHLSTFISGPTGPTSAEANAVLSVYPMQLSRWLDEVWAAGGIADTTYWSKVLTAPAVPIGDLSKSKEPAALLATLLSGVAPDATKPVQVYSGAPGVDLSPPPIWDHLLYAYLIEATGIVEILGDVVRRFVVGETLPAPTTDTVAWVRATEDLFYRDPPLFTAGGPLMSQLRPDAVVNRRNAYWRMFGLDLPHPMSGAGAGQPWKRDVGPTVNTRFLELWNELLRQVWLGFENDTNSSGAKATDSSYVGYLCQTLGEMLRLRRQGGMLAREEFAYVTMMSWFHLTVEYDTSVVADLSANASSAGNPADRLAAIGARVGVSPSRQSRELFELADLVSPLLWSIELGLLDGSQEAEVLYKHDGLPNPVVAMTMNRIVDLWQSATGERVKDLAVTSRRGGMDGRSAQPTRLLPGPAVAPPRTLAPAARPATNGHRPTTLTRG